MPNTHGIIAASGTELAAFPYADPVRGGQIVWHATAYNHARLAAEWMELADEHDRSVGVCLDLVRDLHPRYWEWLHKFTNASFTDRGDARILFTAPAASVREIGPYLPVEAFEAPDGDFVLYIPELFRA